MNCTLRCGVVVRVGTKEGGGGVCVNASACVSSCYCNQGSIEGTDGGVSTSPVDFNNLTWHTIFHFQCGI